jgi:hypothetical protein
MGYMRHHAIIVSDHGYGEHIEDAHREAILAFGSLVSPILPKTINGVRTFLVGPDGSKEGWEPSNTGDKNRDFFTSWLSNQRYEDGSGPLSWVEVQYGDEDGHTSIITHSDEPARRQAGCL